MLNDLISFTLIWLACGSVTWLLACEGLSAEVRLRRRAKGKRTRASHQVIAGLWVMVFWPWTAFRFVLAREMLR